MIRVWIEQAAGGRFAVMAELKPDAVRCYGRYGKLEQAQHRLKQLARSAPPAAAPAVRAPEPEPVGA